MLPSAGAGVVKFLKKIVNLYETTDGLTYVVYFYTQIN